MTQHPTSQEYGDTNPEDRPRWTAIWLGSDGHSAEAVLAVDSQPGVHEEWSAD
jgi:hypothetical protein